VNVFPCAQLGAVFDPVARVAAEHRALLLNPKPILRVSYVV